MRLALGAAVLAAFFFLPLTAVLPPLPLVVIGALPDGGFVDAKNPEDLITSVPPISVAPGSLAGKVLPPDRYLLITAVSLRVSVSGQTGSTDVVFRATDGTNVCDCAFACNISTGNKRVACTGTGGGGCLLPPSADLTYSWESAGDCLTPPTVQGNVDVNGEWQ